MERKKARPPSKHQKYFQKKGRPQLFSPTSKKNFFGRLLQPDEHKPSPFERLVRSSKDQKKKKRLFVSKTRGRPGKPGRRRKKRKVPKREDHEQR
jgi:hypothetical protein